MKAKKAFALLFSISMGISSFSITANAKELTEQQIQQIVQADTEQNTTEEQQIIDTKQNTTDEQQTTDTEQNTTNEQQTTNTEQNTAKEQQTTNTEQTTDTEQNTVKKQQTEMTKKTVTIQFDANGSQGTVPEGVTISTGEEIEIVSTLTKENYF